MNAYEILECSPDASQEQIKASYHNLLLKYHPDKQQLDGSSSDALNHNMDKFLKLQSAYKLLSNLKEKELYDSLLKQTHLKEKADHLSPDEDEFLLSLEKDFVHEESSNVYSRPCRCGSTYSIDKQCITKLLEQISSELDKAKQDQGKLTESLVIVLECDTCSLTINVLII